MTTIALALGAGGARGLAHIHTVRAFDDLGVKPTVVAGTSMGALIGAAYCSGMSGDEITAYIMARVDDPLRLISEVFKARPTSVQSFLEDGGLRIGELNLERILSVFLPDRIKDDFGRLSIPLKVVATDYYAEKAHIFESGPLLPALAASAAMPAVFLPVKVAGRFYIDGSSKCPCPLDVVQDQADEVIAIDVSGGTRGSPSIRPQKFDAMYAASQLMQQSIVRSKVDLFPRTILLRPPVDSFRPLEFLKAKAILEETEALYDGTKRAIERCLAP